MEVQVAGGSRQLTEIKIPNCETGNGSPKDNYSPVILK